MEVFKKIGTEAAQIAARKEAAMKKEEAARALSPWGKRRLNRFKTVNGKRYQLHATRGWKAV